MQTRAIFGLSGVGFLDAKTRAYIGFSATATRLEISGGHEATDQKNSSGVHLASALMVGDVTVEIEGISDATAPMVARLRGGKLVAGSEALSAANKASSVLPAVPWGATTIAAANGKTPLVGAYSIEKGAGDTVIINRLFTPDGKTLTGNTEGTVATTDFAVTAVPNTVAVGTKGYFFWEPATTTEQGEYAFGSLNLPDAVTVIGMTQSDKVVDLDNRNVERVVVPLMQLNPIAQSNNSNEYKNLGTISGKAIHSAAINGCFTTKQFFGI